MFSRITFLNNSIWRRLSFTLTLQNQRINRYQSNLKARHFINPLIATSFGLFMPTIVSLQQNVAPIQKNDTKDQDSAAQKEIVHNQSFLQKFWNIIIHVVRFFHLMLIFTPPIMLSPLLLFKSTRNYWMDCFVKAVERSGVVFIKAFQYLSHRRDIIGPQLATKFQYLRERAPTHSFQTTKKYFRQSYGRNIQDIFEQFDSTPIASGSVSQVYKAKYRGKKVAVKVRHPGVEQYIERDINLMFYLSHIASFFSPAMEVPISQDSLKRTLTEQMDFTFEMRNLKKFTEMFKQNEEVYFPLPFEQNTKDTVLIETFVEGVPVTYYEKKPHALNKVIARIGSTTFFEMLMKNNFIHGDCHGGNIIVDIQEQSYNFMTEIVDFFSELYFGLETKIKSMKFEVETMKKLYIQSRQEQLSIKKLVRKYKQKIIVNLIDVGMVIQLDDKDKKNFVNFIKSIIEGKGDICAQMIYSLSNFQGKKILEGTFQGYKRQLKACFSILDGQALADLKGINLFGDMLQIIRQNRMKLDGQFATLLTNMIVLEAIAKDLDPEISILKCAFPYFKYVEDFGVYTK